MLPLLTRRSSITSFAGVDSGADQSGNHESKSIRTSKSGPPELRKALFLVMDCLLKSMPQECGKIHPLLRPILSDRAVE